MQTTGTVLGAVSLLWQTGMHFIALIVLATAFVVPGAELALLLVALGRQVPTARTLRWLKWMRPWAMIDVFVLGVIVSIKKLADMATIIPGPALWAFCALMFLIPALRNGLDFPALWSRVSFPGISHAR